MPSAWRQGWFASPLGWAVLRYAAAFAIAAVLGSAYFAVGRYTAASHHDLSSALDGWVPFVPETVWIYFPFYVAIFHVGTFGILDAEIFFRTMASISLAALACTAVFLFYPSTMSVPQLADDGTWTT